MTGENDSAPWAIWIVKFMGIIFLTALPAVGVQFLLLTTFWVPSDWVGPTLLLSGIVFFIGAIVLLENKNARVWAYSIIGGSAIGLATIILSLLWQLTFIPFPLFGNAFYAVVAAAISLGLTLAWLWPTQKDSLHSGLVASSAKETTIKTSTMGLQLFRQKSTSVLALELKEIPHDYAFANMRDNSLDVIERFHSVARTLTSTPFGFRMQRAKWNTRIFYFTWSSDEDLLKHQLAVLNDALQHNLPGFRLDPVGKFPEIRLDDNEKGCAAIMTGAPLSILDEKQRKDPLEAMTGVFQDLENGVYQVFIEPMKMSKSKIKTLEKRFKELVEKSETTISREQSSWMGSHQESRTSINLDAKKEAELLERQIRRLSNTNLYKATVTAISWAADISKADFDVRRLVVPLIGGIRPDNDHEEFRIEYRSRKKDVERLLACHQVGRSTILTADEVTVYTVISRKDANIRVTKREKFSSGTKEVGEGPDLVKQESDRVTSLVLSKVKWVKRKPVLFFGHPIDENGNILSKAYVTTEIRNLNMHLAVLGNTRSGKSTSIMSIFGQAITLGVTPILLVPSKSYEMRFLLNIFHDIRFFTCGRSDIANLLLNIWNPPKNVPLAKWADRIVQAWTLWLPNDPVISMHFEKVVYTMYRRCGWNLKKNVKGRAILLTDLIEALEEEDERLSYGNEVSSNVFGALVERIRSILRKYTLVEMFNTKTGITIEELLSHPTIIDMDALSESDKILLMGILTAGICEYKLANPTKNVTNLLILEEAHYLLGSTNSGGEANSDARLHAVNAFIELLRVGGGPGLGVVIADQSPTTLVPQALKIVVNLIIHALSDSEDRRLVGRHSRCTEAQMDHIGGMQVGEAVVYLQHEGVPKNVKMFTISRFIQGAFPDNEVSDKALKKHMTPIILRNPHLQEHEPIPDDSAIQLEHGKKKDNDNLQVLEPTVSRSSEIQRIIKTPLIARFCERCLKEQDYSTLARQLQTISNTHGDGSWSSVLQALKFLVLEYGTPENLGQFEGFSRFLDGEHGK